MIVLLQNAIFEEPNSYVCITYQVILIMKMTTKLAFCLLLQVNNVINFYLKQFDSDCDVRFFR